MNRQVKVIVTAAALGAFLAAGSGASAKTSDTKESKAYQLAQYYSAVISQIATAAELRCDDKVEADKAVCQTYRQLLTGEVSMLSLAVFSSMKFSDLATVADNRVAYYGYLRSTAKARNPEHSKSEKSYLDIVIKRLKQVAKNTRNPGLMNP